MDESTRQQIEQEEQFRHELRVKNIEAEERYRIEVQHKLRENSPRIKTAEEHAAERAARGEILTPSLLGIVRPGR